MPVISPEKLHRIGCEVLEAAGCTADDARSVVDHLVDSNLFGHDSHGAIRLPEYVKAIKDEGRFKARADVRIVRESPCTAVVDNGGALGQVGGSFAMRLAMEKARNHGTATVSLRRTSHVGRVGAYPLMAAREGLIGLAFVNAGRFGRQIPPFGGIDGRISTNPIAFSAPRRNADPVLVDLTTSVVAEGKVRVAANKGVRVPEGWLIDHEGNPTTDPTVIKGPPPNGAILPMGGIVAHKGYSLGVLVEILGGTLSGQGCAQGEQIVESNGVLFTVYDISFFSDLDWYYEEVEGMIQHVKASRTAPGFDEILLPGEPEFRLAATRRQEGISIDDTTWRQIEEAGIRVGLNPENW